MIKELKAKSSTQLATFLSLLMAINMLLIQSCSEDDDQKKDSANTTPFLIQAGGPNYDAPAASVTDADGNIYITGSFNGTISFGTTSLTSEGNEDIFLAKYSSDGKLVWARRDGGTKFDKAYSMTIDGSGNIYIAGAFNGTTSIAGQSLTAKGQYNVFIAKYSSSGNGLWAIVEGKATDNYGLSVAQSLFKDANDNFYITGYYYLNAVFGDNTITAPESEYHFYVAKLNSDGEVQGLNTKMT
jgi:hypothetical protein